MICKYCGQELNPGMKFCIGCGKPVENEEPAAETIPAENPVTVENNISSEPEQTPVENDVTAEPEQTPVENNFNAEPEQPAAPTVAPVFSNPSHYGQGAGYYGNASNNAPYGGNVQNNAPYGNVQNNVPYGNMQNNANVNNMSRPVYTAPVKPSVNDEPLSAWAYAGLMLLFSCTCCVGWIFMFVFAFSSEGNVHRKKFAQGYLIVWIVSVIICIAIGILYGAAIVALIKSGEFPTYYDPEQWSIVQGVTLFKSLF